VTTDAAEKSDRWGKEGGQKGEEEKGEGFLPVGLDFSQIIFYFAKSLTVRLE
jgi:hypothetical protein